MNIGVIRQTRDDERRVPVVPAGVHLLTKKGHTVHIEHDAGAAAGFTDQEYLDAGAQIVYSRTEAVGRANLVLGVAHFLQEDVDLFVPGQSVLSFGHLGTLTAASLRGMIDKKLTAVAYEWIENDRGQRPIVEIMGEVAGPIALTLASTLLETQRGGRGILLSGLPGVPPAQVVVIGGGSVGMAAVRAALGKGAQVILFDKDPEKLRDADRLFDRRVITFLSYRYTLERVLKNADVVIGAVRVHGSKPPIVITREMVRQMKPGTVIVDCSIDQGGICETGRPTTLSDPKFVVDNVIHCCIPNMPSAVARTSSFALANTLFPYIRWFAEGGLPAVLADQPRFAEGIYLREGQAVHPVIKAMAEQTAPTSTR